MTGARALLNRHVFAPVETAGARSRVALVLGLVTGAAGGALVLWRQPGSALDNPWAEDGSIFLAQAYRSPLSHLLFVRYAGYPSVYPRLVGALAAHVAVRDAPVVLALGGALACAVAVLVVIVCSAGQIASLPLRVLLGAAVALFPAAGIEIAASVCNAQWYLIAAAPWCLLWRGRSTAAGVGLGLVLFLGASNDPLLGLLLPLAVLRVVAFGRWRDRLPVLGLVVGLAVQIPAVLRPDLVAPVVRPSIADLVGSWIWRGPTEAVLGPQLSHALGEGAVVTAVTLTALAVGVCAVVGGPRRIWLATGALVLSAGLFGAAAHLRWTPGFAMYQPMTDGSRYDLVPTMLCLTVLVLALDAVVERAHGAQMRVVRLIGPAGSVVLGVGLIAASVGGQTLSNTRGPSWSAQLPAARAECRVKPGRASVLVKTAPPWVGAIPVPCSVLESS
jgi:hypothetical protein